MRIAALRRFVIPIIILGVPLRLALADDTLTDAGDVKSLSLEQLMDIQVTSVSRSPEKLLNAASAIQFVDWPAGAFPRSDAPVLIGVLGEDPFGSFLDETVEGEKVGNHPLVVRRYRSVNEIRNCVILFISRSEAPRLPEILEQLKGRNILIVSDVENFAQRGGMIQFVTENNKIRLRINIQAAKAANLVISSKLLRLSEIVEGAQGDLVPLRTIGAPQRLLAEWPSTRGSPNG